jgi:hypothetical protein
MDYARRSITAASTTDFDGYLSCATGPTVLPAAKRKKARCGENRLIKAVQHEAAVIQLEVHSESTAELRRGSQARVGMLPAVDKGPPLSKIIIGTGLDMTDLTLTKLIMY